MTVKKEDRYSVRALPSDDDPKDHRPTVLFVGINAPTFSAAGQIAGWKDIGYSVSFFDWQHVKFNEGIDGMRERLLMKARMESPALIFMQIQNPDAIDVETARSLQDIAPVINFSEDIREDITWYEQVGAVIELTVFTNIPDVDALSKKGINAYYTPNSYNHLLYHPKDTSHDTTDYGRIVFLGNNYLGSNLNFPQAQERYDMVQFLKKEYPNDFKVHGRNWGPDSKMLTPAEAAIAYNKCDIAITHSNFIRRGYFSDRTMNAIGCGAYTIIHSFPAHNHVFPNKKEVWSFLDSLKSEIDNALTNMSSADRKEKAYSDMKHVVNNHQWRNRFSEILTVMSITNNK